MTKWLLLMLLPVLTAGCAILEIFTGPQMDPEPPLPFDDIRRIAVVPVLIQPVRDEHGNPIQLDSELLGRILAEEWTKFAPEGGLEMVFPRETAITIRNQEIFPDSAANLVKIGRIHKADAVCLIQINHFQSFSPKSCTLTFKFYRTEQKDFAGYSLVNITEMGSDLPEEKPPAELALIQRRWDGEDDRVRRRAEAWMNRGEREMQTEWRRVFEVNNEYFRFIFNATLRDYVVALTELIEKNAEPGEHRFTPPSLPGMGN